jgi:hypothetical protein
VKVSAFVNRASMRGFLVLSAGLAPLCLAAPVARAGSAVVGELFPPPVPQVTSRISGVTSDGQGGLLILENRGDIKRVSATNAAVLGTTVVLAPGFSRSSLEYRPATGDLYTTRLNSAGVEEVLYRIAPGGLESPVGLTGGHFAFPSLAMDPQDNLWAFSASSIYTSNTTPTLYTLDKSSGVASFATTITGVSQFDQIHTLVIDEFSRFFVSTANNIYQVNPSTGAASPATTTGLPSLSFFSDLAFDSATDKWYGIEERRGTSPRTYFLREISGMPAVPEPAAVLLVAPLAVSIFRRRRPTLRAAAN